MCTCSKEADASGIYRTYSIYIMYQQIVFTRIAELRGDNFVPTQAP